MATAQEVEVHYKGLIGELRDALDAATTETAKLTGAAIHGDPVDVSALKNLHLSLTDALNLAKNVTGEPQGNPVGDTGEGSHPELPPPPSFGVKVEDLAPATDNPDN